MDGVKTRPYSANGESSSYNFFKPVEKLVLEDEAAAISFCGSVESVTLCLPRIFRRFGIIRSSSRITRPRQWRYRDFELGLSSMISRRGILVDEK